MEYDYLYKIILLGDSGTGKTSIMNRYLDNSTPQCTHEPTIGVDFRLKTETEIDGKKIKLHLWDTAGQECFRSIIEGYYRGIAAAVIVFDITNYRSFQSVTYWLNEIARNSSTNVRAPILLIGNKSDLVSKRRVPCLEAETFATENRLIYVETSAANTDNVDHGMQLLVHAITEHYIVGNIESAGVRRGVRLVSSIETGPCGRHSNSSFLDCCRPS